MTEKAANNVLHFVSKIRPKRLSKNPPKDPYIRGLLEAIANEMIITDDLGEVWYWSEGRIRLAAAELEMFDEKDMNGYYCANFEKGVKTLEDFGYITKG